MTAATDPGPWLHDPMRILVLGGTRFLSREVCRIAQAAGHEVIAASRTTADLPAGVRHVRLDRTEGAESLADLPAIDVVVDVARQPSWVRDAVTLVPAAHWVFVSTVSVYADGETLHDPIHDDVDLASTPEAYGGMKVACEAIVADGAASSWIVRPGLIVGPGDPSGRYPYWPMRFAEAARDGGPVLAPGSPEDLDQVVDVRDLAAWIVRGAQERRTGVVDGVGPVLARGDLLRDTAEGAGSQPDLVWVDDEILLEHDVVPWMGPRSLPLWIPSSIEPTLVRDPEPARAAGLRCRGIAETARDVLAWADTVGEVPLTGLTRAEELELLEHLAGH